MAGLKMKYFVLKPKGNDAHAIASRLAMSAYALSIRDTDSGLSDDLVEWIQGEAGAAGEKEAESDG